MGTAAMEADTATAGMEADTATAGMEADSGNTIVDLSAGSEDLSTLVSLVTEAGLVETLSGEGPFTVFAPTNAAFDALPEGTLDGLSVENLTQILTYHVVPGSSIMSTDLQEGI